MGKIREEGTRRKGSERRKEGQPFRPGIVSMLNILYEMKTAFAVRVQEDMAVMGRLLKCVDGPLMGCRAGRGLCRV